MREIVVATRSAYKLRELTELLGSVPGLRLIDLNEAGIPERREEDALEVHPTFVENALAKARYFARISHRPVLADDSGLCVDALGGEPGVHSKRFSGRTDLRGPALDRANNSLLLARLSDVPQDRRSAHYVCALALVDPDGAEQTFEGRCDGFIVEDPRGDAGFGYDPLFRSSELHATFAEVEPEQKNRVSHRARAVAAARSAVSGRDRPPD